MAPHRGLRCIGNGAAVLLCMGLFLRFFYPPGSFDVSDDRLAAVMDVDVFNRHFLLPLAAVLVKGADKRCRGSWQLDRHVEVPAPLGEGVGVLGAKEELAARQVASKVYCGFRSCVWACYDIGQSELICLFRVSHMVMRKLLYILCLVIVGLVWSFRDARTRKAKR